MTNIRVERKYITTNRMEIKGIKRLLWIIYANKLDKLQNF